MEIIIDFPGGARVNAHFGSFTVQTDQSAQDGGEGSAPTPLALFLASIATCIGIYVLRFCRQRGLNTDGLRITQRTHTNSVTGMVGQVELEIELPKDFPEKYKSAIINAAELCTVKKHLQKPPTFDIRTKMSF
jgi:ribosomal protein S12 methylthiotransferase accessory factor